MDTDVNRVALVNEEDSGNNGVNNQIDTPTQSELKGDASAEETDAVMPSELEEMLGAGLHLGHLRSRSHPKMKPFIFTTRNDLQFIDVTETSKRLDTARSFLRGVVANGGSILLVGTRPAVRSTVRNLAEALGLPHVTTRWLGGTLTNFKTISQRLAEKADLERRRASGEFEKYTKKEALMLERKLKKLEDKFGGIAALSRLPQAVVIFDLSENKTSAREAKRLGIPTVAVVDTNVDPELATYPIPANDDAVSAVRYLSDKIGEAIREGQAECVRLAAERARAEAESSGKAAL